MATSRRALRAVNEEQQEPIGDVSLTQETMAGWSEGQRRCRARKRHNWGPYTVYEHRGRNNIWYDVIEVCSHCRNRRSATYLVTERGLRKEGKWQPVYRDGYLLPHGAMRIDEDLHDELTASDILSRKVVEVPDDADAQDDELENKRKGRKTRGA